MRTPKFKPGQTVWISCRPAPPHGDDGSYAEPIVLGPIESHPDIPGEPFYLTPISDGTYFHFEDGTPWGHPESQLTATKEEMEDRIKSDPRTYGPLIQEPK